MSFTGLENGCLEIAGQVQGRTLRKPKPQERAPEIVQHSKATFALKEKQEISLQEHLCSFPPHQTSRQQKAALRIRSSRQTSSCTGGAGMEVPAHRGLFLDFSQPNSQAAASCSLTSNCFHLYILPPLSPASCLFLLLRSRYPFPSGFDLTSIPSSF